MEKTEKTNWLKILLPFILSVVLSAGFFMGVKISSNKPGNLNGGGFNAAGGAQITNIINYIVESYVDSINPAVLTEGAIHSLLRELDPHSAFIPAREFNERIDPLIGTFEGIGIEFNMMNDTVLIISPIADGPSEKVGIMPGDKIIEVNDEKIAGVGKSSSEVVGLLKGPKGTKVNMKIKRQGVTELLPFTITRDKIPQYSLDVAYMVNHYIGYLRFNRFSATTYQEFKAAIERLLGSGMEKLILDLRGNTGGYLDAAIKMADEILEENKLIVYTEGRRRSKQVARAKGRGLIENTPIVVLIDEWSASASEIVAGAIQDNDRGLIIGRRSFGKGLVQEQVHLQDGSALLLTVARYFTPSGRSIQKPYKNGHGESPNDLISGMGHQETAEPMAEDAKNAETFLTVGGRKVFGGGGIAPDIVLPVQVGEKFIYLNQILNRGLFYRFAFEQGDKLRTDIKKVGKASEFASKFVLPNRIYYDFINFAINHGVRGPARIDPEVESTIRAFLKAYLGRVILGPEAFYPVINLQDKTFLRALEVLSGSEYEVLLKPRI